MAKSYFFHFAPIRGRMAAPIPHQSSHAPLPERDVPSNAPPPDGRREDPGRCDAPRNGPRRDWRDEDDRW